VILKKKKRRGFDERCGEFIRAAFPPFLLLEWLKNETKLKWEDDPKDQEKNRIQQQIVNINILSSSFLFYPRLKNYLFKPFPP